ncbi:hypothetical protein [Pumilibacter muris]|uniref:hypothetical protein n=1 Tax=Pumilibacter muris TaxID=2941510 RepID=UPI0020422528|nr:hypothetical protein [Pumilibacter muris]
MCKTKGVFARFAVSVLLAFAMASAMFGGGYALFARAEEQAPAEVMTDPVFKQFTMNTISGKEDSVKLMSDDTVHFVMHPTPGIGARATAAELGDGYRFDVKDGVTVVLHDVNITDDAYFLAGMQTDPAGAPPPGGGGGIHMAMTVMNYPNSATPGYYFTWILGNNDTTVWSPLGQPFMGADVNAWHADTVTLTYSDTSFSIVTTGATTGDISETRNKDTAGFANLFKDFTESGDAYLSFNVYNPNAGQATGEVEFNLMSVNDKAPGAAYKEALNAQVTAFTTAVAKAEESENQSDIDAAVALNKFGTDEAYGKLLTQFGNVDQQRDVRAARDKIVALNGDAIFAELKTPIEGYIAALDAVTPDNEDTALSATVTAYNAIDWSKYDLLNAGFKAQIDELKNTMKGKSYFKKSIEAVADAHIKVIETATASEFNSSAGYVSAKAALDGWDAYKAANFIGELTEAKVAALDARVADAKTKTESSFYHNFTYRGNVSEVQKYDEGLYLSVQPDVYDRVEQKLPTDNVVLAKEKMTLNENSEVRFNMIYAPRLAVGSFQMQIGFYPVANATTYESDGVRVDFWTSNMNMTEIKPVNGKTELPICGERTIQIEDEDFFDFEADELDYKQSAYTVKLCSDEDGLYLLVNGLRLDIEDEAITPELFKDGVYVTFSASGSAGMAPYELLVTKIGGTKYADVPETPDNPNNPDNPDNPEKPNEPAPEKKKKCGAVAGASVSVVSALICLLGASAFIAARRGKKNRA